MTERSMIMDLRLDRNRATDTAAYHLTGLLGDPGQNTNEETTYTTDRMTGRQ